MCGIDEHSLCHSGVTPRRAVAAARNSAGGAIPCVRKPATPDLVPSWNDWLSTTVNLVRGRLRVPTIRVARRSGPARRQSAADHAGSHRDVPPGRGARLADGGFSQAPMYIGSGGATMLSSALGGRSACTGRNILGLAAPPAHIRRCRGGSRWSRRAEVTGASASRCVECMVKFIRFLFVCAVILAIAGTGFVGITIWHFGRDLPDYQQLASYQPPITTRVQAGDGRLLAEYATERRIFLPIEAIPKPVVDAFISAEDKNFYSHHGIDPLSIFRAAITDIGRLRANRRPVGASTITQQVAKNMLLTNEVSIARKIKEMLLATRIEAALPKERILELYLNEIYLGSGAYGVAAAAMTYFDKSLDQLSLGEAAFLGGLPKAPNRYNPVRLPEAATARRDWVLDRMVEDGVVSREAADQAKAQPIELHHRQEADEVRAPYFAEEVRRQLLARYGERALYEAGFSVRTSLDPSLQAAADKALREGLIGYAHAHEG